MMLRVLSVIAVAVLMYGCGSSDSSKSAATLDMHTWEVVQIGAEGLELVPEEERPTFKFDSKTMKVSGSTGCNTYNGGYDLDLGGMHFGPAAVTKKACSDMTIETAFLDALKKTAKVDFDNSMLKLIDASGLELLEAVPQSK